MFSKGGGKCDERPEAALVELSPEESQAMTYSSEMGEIIRRATRPPRGRKLPADGAALYQAQVDQMLVFKSREDEFKMAMIAKYHPDERMRKLARDQIVLRNQRWVIQQAYSKEWAGRGVEPEELIQAGNEGLLIAVDKFEPERGITYLTHAKWWVKQKQQRTTEKDSAGMFGARVPMEVYNDIHKVRRALIEFEKEQVYDPSPEQIHQRVNDNNPNANSHLSRERVDQAVGIFMNRPTSMQQRLRSDDGSETEFGNTLPSNAPTVEAEHMQDFERERLRGAMNRAFNSLDPEERTVLAASYGLGSSQAGQAEEEGNESGHMMDVVFGSGAQRDEKSEEASADELRALQDRFGWKQDEVRRLQRSAAKKLRAKLYPELVALGHESLASEYAQEQADKAARKSQRAQQKVLA